jgi:phosphoserine phosphatase RsbU/P
MSAPLSLLSTPFAAAATKDLLDELSSSRSAEPTSYFDSTADPSPTLDEASDLLASLLHQTRERDDLLARVQQLESEIEVLRRRDRALSYHMAKLDEEQRLAARIQQDFLPKSLPQVGRVKFQTLFRPASYVSGDIYDVCRLDEKNVGVSIADAVGHGMPAALLTMFIKQAIVTKEIKPGSYRLLDPSETLTRLNTALRQQDLAASTFATAVYARIDCTSLVATFSRGGHPAPLIINRQGDLKEVPGDGPLLGIFDDEQFAQETVQLEPGDRVFLHSDGLELCFQSKESGQIDPLIWREELLKRSTLSTAEILAAFAQSNPGSDDLTIVVAEVG